MLQVKSVKSLSMAGTSWNRTGDTPIARVFKKY